MARKTEVDIRVPVLVFEDGSWAVPWKESSEFSMPQNTELFKDCNDPETPGELRWVCATVKV